MRVLILEGVNLLKKINNIRIGWLKFMYVWNIVISGGGGIGIIFFPELTKWLFNVSSPTITYGVIGSVFLAFSIISIFGLREPLKFVPILLFQLIYKLIWIIGVILPMLISGEFYMGAIPAIAIYIIYIIGDLIAIPFSNIFQSISKENIN